MGGWTGGWYPADLVNGEPEASKLTPIRHTYEKAFRLVVRSDLCQLRYEAAASNELYESRTRKRRRKRRKERRRRRWWRNWRRRGTRLSIFTSSLNYENFVSLLEISLLREMRVLPPRDSSMVLLGNTAGYFWFRCAAGINVDLAFALCTTDNSLLHHAIDRDSVGGTLRNLAALMREQ